MGLEVILYGRPDCHLCDAARQVILPLKSEFAFEFREVDVDTDAELQKRYGADVPIVLLNGVEAARHRVGREEFRALLVREARRTGEPGN